MDEKEKRPKSKNESYQKITIIRIIHKMKTDPIEEILYKLYRATTFISIVTITN